MTAGMRWRVITLQVVIVFTLGGVTGLLYWANQFTTNQVRDELVAQQIYFPGTDQIKAGGALDPAEFPAEIQQYAGTQVDTGDKARVYANDFIGIHLTKVANGKTYAQVSSDQIAANAVLTNMQKTDPGYAAQQAKVTTLSGQKTTLFQGEMLRASLLQAYAWWTMGIYAGFAAIGTALATLAVLGALVFEVFVAVRRPEKVAIATQAPAPA
jgi:hypothetical protein